MERYNRVKVEWDKWQVEEQMLEKLVPPGRLKTDRPHLKEKLAFFNELGTKYTGTLTNEERRTLKVLQQDKNDLIKVLYPNSAMRLLFKLSVPFKQQQIARQIEKTILANEQAITATLIRCGFGEVNSQVIGLMKQGRESFSVPVSSYIGEKERVDYTLSFVKNQYDQYVLEQYKATLNNGADKRNQIFSPEQNISANQAYHLLAGRAFLKDDPEVPWKTEQWIQLDFNDKDALGNYRIKVLNKDESYNLDGLLWKAGIKDNLPGVIQALKNGEQVFVTLKGSKYLVEANPHYKTLNVTDGLGNKQSIEEALQYNKKIAKIIPLKPVVQKTKRAKGPSH